MTSRGWQNIKEMKNQNKTFHSKKGPYECDLCGRININLLDIPHTVIFIHCDYGFEFNLCRECFGKKLHEFELEKGDQNE